MLKHSLCLYIQGLERCINNSNRRDAHLPIINGDVYEVSLFTNHCPVLEYSRTSVFGISAFCGHTFYTIVCTLHGYFCGISMRPCDWQVGLPHYRAITEITPSPVILCLSLSEVVLFLDGMRVSFSCLMYSLLPKYVYIFFRNKASYFLCFWVFLHWYFIHSWNQRHFTV
jgi:hypothetical protein